MQVSNKEKKEDSITRHNCLIFLHQVEKFILESEIFEEKHKIDLAREFLNVMHLWMTTVFCSCFLQDLREKIHLLYTELVLLSYPADGPMQFRYPKKPNAESAKMDESKPKIVKNKLQINSVDKNFVQQHDQGVSLKRSFDDGGSKGIVKSGIEEKRQKVNEKFFINIDFVLKEAGLLDDEFLEDEKLEDDIKEMRINMSKMSKENKQLMLSVARALNK